MHSLAAQESRVTKLISDFYDIPENENSDSVEELLHKISNLQNKVRRFCLINISKSLNIIHEPTTHICFNCLIFCFVTRR